MSMFESRIGCGSTTIYASLFMLSLKQRPASQHDTSLDRQCTIFKVSLLGPSQSVNVVLSVASIASIPQMLSQVYICFTFYVWVCTRMNSCMHIRQYVCIRIYLELYIMNVSNISQ